MAHLSPPEPPVPPTITRGRGGHIPMEQLNALVHHVSEDLPRYVRESAEWEALRFSGQQQSSSANLERLQTLLALGALVVAVVALVIAL